MFNTSSVFLTLWSQLKTNAVKRLPTWSLIARLLLSCNSGNEKLQWGCNFINCAVYITSVCVCVWGRIAWFATGYSTVAQLITTLCMECLHCTCMCSLVFNSHCRCRWLRSKRCSPVYWHNWIIALDDLPAMLDWNALQSHILIFHGICGKCFKLVPLSNTQLCLVCQLCCNYPACN